MVTFGRTLPILPAEELGCSFGSYFGLGLLSLKGGWGFLCL